jgi:hypothetical protein
MAAKAKPKNPFGGAPGYHYDDATIPFANKDEYVAKAIKFRIIDVFFEASGGFESADRWVVVVDVSDGRGLEALTFGTNPGRDAAMKEAKACLEADVPLEGLTLARSGNAYYINSAS